MPAGVGGRCRPRRAGGDARLVGVEVLSVVRPWAGGRRAERCPAVPGGRVESRSRRGALVVAGGELRSSGEMVTVGPPGGTAGWHRTGLRHRCARRAGKHPQRSTFVLHETSRIVAARVPLRIASRRRALPSRPTLVRRPGGSPNASCRPVGRTPGRWALRGWRRGVVGGWSCDGPQELGGWGELLVVIICRVAPSGVFASVALGWAGKSGAGEC